MSSMNFKEIEAKEFTVTSDHQSFCLNCLNSARDSTIYFELFYFSGNSSTYLLAIISVAALHVYSIDRRVEPQK